MAGILVQVNLPLPGAVEIDESIVEEPAAMGPPIAADFPLRIFNPWSLISM
jgi:hypothetical protein